MVLLVPDDSDDVTEELSSSEDSGQAKAQLDDSEANKASQKVDLDLDDAPFLEDEEEEEEEIALEEETPLLDEAEEKPGFDFKALLKNKLFLIFSGVILILIAVILFLLLRTPEETPPPPPPPPPVAEPVDESPAQEPEVIEETPEILIQMQPFFIEQRDKKNVIRFLEIQIAVSTLDPSLARQFRQETYTIRNAIYYYMKNKDLHFLSDKKNGEKLKKELLGIINQYMGFGEFDSLMFDKYLVR